MSHADPMPPRKGFDPFFPVSCLIAAAFSLIVILTLAHVFCRHFLDNPILWSEELSRLVVVWMTFIGSAAVC